MQTTNLPSERLKAATHASHKHIEKCPRLKRVFAADYRLEEYVELLQRFYGFYEQVEPLIELALVQAGETRFICPAKTPLLIADLTALNSPYRKAPQPTAVALPAIPNAVSAIGVSYVLEGSTLGGQFISKHLKAHFNNQAPLGFYQSYGIQAASHWQAFKHKIDQRFAEEETGIEGLIQAALATFQSLSAWMED